MVGRSFTAATATVERWRHAQLDDPRHSERTAAILGSLLGVSFVVCFLTGLVSHVHQHPNSVISFGPNPAGWFRLNQGLHVTTGIAAVPLLLAKLWSVFPNLFRWPLADNVLHAVERLSILPLVGGSIFMLVTGVANIDLWYPWVFFFPSAHYTVAYVVMGALLIHLVAKWATARHALARGATRHEAPATTVGRRQFLRSAGLLSAGLVMSTVGQTAWHFRKLSIFAPRRPDIGPQGFPVNKTAGEARVTEAAADPAYTLTIESKRKAIKTFTLDELRAASHHSATLPIACVEGWSASRPWRGVSVRELLTEAGAPEGRSVSVESLQKGGRYRRSILTAEQIDDPDTMLAMFVNDEPLHRDHGYPLRLIAPNRPGVLQTKWVSKLVVQ
jgi:DMSO/TMAO reductase YedYZ molybdopterin-dependent catalytic subunit